MNTNFVDWPTASDQERRERIQLFAMSAAIAKALGDVEALRQIAWMASEWLIR